MDNEKINVNAPDGTDISRADIKAKKKEEKKRRKFEKKELKRLRREHEKRAAVIPPSKRPMICPPDFSDASKKYIIAGMILRVLIIVLTVAAISFFISEAFGFDMTPEYIAQKKIENYGGTPAGAGLGFILPFALLFVGAIALSALWKYGKFIGIPVIAAAALIAALPSPAFRLYEAALAAYNSALGHMKYMGFYAIDVNQVAATNTTGTNEELVRTAVIYLVLICSLVFAPFLIKRARIAVPAVFSAAVMVFIFVYNLSRSNWALGLTICGFCAIIVLYLFDRIFIAKQKPDSTDDIGNIFGDLNEPVLPEHLRDKKGAKRLAKLEKRRAKREKKELRKQRKLTVDQEISDYFAESSAAKPAKTKLTREQKTAAKAEKKQVKALAREQKLSDRRAVDSLKSYKDRVLLRRASLAGIAGACMFVVALIAVSFPAATAKGSFETIPAIDEKLEYYRDYITAYLMGDDPSLDLLAYEGDASNFSPRDTTATPRYYTYEPIMTVESNYTSGIYLRGWIGTYYEDGMWHTAEPKSETLERYRSIFATNDDASESIYYNFFRIMTDDGIYDEDKDVTNSLKRLEKYGYSIAQVNMKRTEEFDDILLYMPSFHIRAYSPGGTSTTNSPVNYLRAYGSSEPGQITYANFFDGIYTSYRAGLQGYEGYAAVAMIPTMKSDNLEYNLGALIVEYNKTRAAVANGREQLEKHPEDDRLGKFSVTLYDGTVLEYTVVSIAEDGTKVIHIPQDVGTAVYTIKPDGDVDREMIDTPIEIDRETGEPIEYYAPKLDRAVLYFEQLDNEGIWYFNRQAELLDRYVPFVYDTYTQRAGSQIITDLYREIVANAVVEQDYADPIPADFSLAANKSLYQYNEKKETYKYLTGVTDREVYVQRHALVMEIIDYLCDEERYTYTLNPTVLGEENTLDGIETFLTKTREGYCVQYASSLVLLLREAGIPARYVEGYIASGFRNNREDDAVSRYKTTVRDNNAHAWAEVWYDGIGWVQYECTPEFYDAMYTNQRPSSGTTRPPVDPVDPDQGEENPEVGPTPWEIEQMLEEQRKQALRELIRKIIIITSVTVVIIAAIAVFFAIVLKRAKKSARERAELLAELYAVNEKSETLPEREKVRAVGEMIMKLLAECGIEPEPGEFGEDFAVRIVSECERELAMAAPIEGLSEFDAPRHPLREEQLKRIFESIAAEEFGNGAPARDLCLMARMYYRLHATLYRRRVNPFKRAVLYLFKRES